MSHSDFTRLRAVVAQRHASDQYKMARRLIELGSPDFAALQQLTAWTSGATARTLAGHWDI